MTAMLKNNILPREMGINDIWYWLGNDATLAE